MANLTTRPATHADVPTLLEFEQGVIAAERPFDPTLKKGSIHYYDLELMIIAPDIELIVALLDDKIVASGYARIESSKHYLQHPRYAYLGFMYVDPAFRGKGYNKAIIDSLKAWARLQDITELRLDVYYSNSPAVRAYEKAGFTKHMIEMRLGLDGV
jgi:GNAT superfamily N-acetyltransferase